MKEFVILVIVAAIIAAPVARFLGTNWLGNFPYRVDVGMGIILLVLVQSLMFACLTVYFQSHRAAIKNPVEHLKIE